MGNISNLSFSLPAEHLAPLSASHCPAVALRSEFEGIFLMIQEGGPNISLHLYLLPFRGAEVKVTVHYETSPSCTAVQWLQPAQTAGKIHPYLYTQCQVCTYREGNLLGSAISAIWVIIFVEKWVAIIVAVSLLCFEWSSPIYCCCMAWEPHMRYGSCRSELQVISRQTRVEKVFLAVLCGVFIIIMC